MAIFNYAAREMTAKIVYYGPGLSGKTTSIQHVHAKINPKSKGKLVSLATETDRTLFFDFFPLEFGQIGGFKVKFNFYTVPGQVFYNTTRKLVLKGADGVVFVADSQPGMMEQNVESLENLKENLTAHGIDEQTVPFIIQYNKRDIPGALPLEALRRTLNARGAPEFETVATSGAGIMEAMKAICRLVLEDLQEKQRGVMGKAAPSRPAARPQSTARPEPASARAPESTVETVPVEPPPVAQPPERPLAPRSAGEERRVSIPANGPGASRVVLRLPVELELEAGVESVEVATEVRITCAGGRARVVVRDLSVEPTSDAPPREKGFLARLFGRGR